jgi:acyl dehydratase
MPTEVQGVEGMKALVGQEIGPSEWRTITQAEIDAFAELSGDHQWIHVDPERAKTESPYGTTIAHGNLTLATVDGFRGELISSTGGLTPPTFTSLQGGESRRGDQAAT